MYALTHSWPVRSVLHACFLLALLAGQSASAAPTASWPTQPIRIVVGYPAGTSPDLVARVVAEPLSHALGKPVIVENKPGAAGNIGVDNVARSSDGHTFGITAQGPLTTSKLLYRSLPYDVAKDLQPLSLAAVSPQVFIVGNDLPVRTMAEFLAYARNQKEGVTYGSVGVGSGSHLTGELFAHDAGIAMVHVPYAGFPQVTTAIIGGQIQAAFMAPSGALAQAKAGRVRVLGVSSSQPSSLAPGVPTVAQGAGLPGFNAELWIAVYAPASMPEAVAARLSKEINAALRTPQAREKLEAEGWEAVGGDRAAMARRIEADTATWGGIIKQLGITLD